jgi:hypothetical protein
MIDITAKCRRPELSRLGLWAIGVDQNVRVPGLRGWNLLAIYLLTAG